MSENENEPVVEVLEEKDEHKEVELPQGNRVNKFLFLLFGICIALIVLALSIKY